MLGIAIGWFARGTYSDEPDSPASKPDLVEMSRATAAATAGKFDVMAAASDPEKAYEAQTAFSVEQMIIMGMEMMEEQDDGTIIIPGGP